MARVQVTPDDLKKSAILDPDWYPAEVKEYNYEKSKKGDSFNHVYDFKVLSPEKFSGVIVRIWFSEKALGSNEFVQFFEALTGTKVDRQKGFEVPDMAAAKGRKVDIHVKNGLYEGRPTNNIDGFRPAGS